MIFKKSHIKQRVRTLLAQGQENHSLCCENRGEGGFLMLTLVGLIVLLSAAYTSYAFVQKKQYNWDYNYALGQQYAQIARAAHLYVQAVSYDPRYDLDPRRAIFLNGAGPGNEILLADLVADGFLPDGFNIQQNRYGTIDIRLFSDLAPRTGTGRSPSAYILMDLDLKTDGGGNEIQRRNPSDVAAFRAGAASVGMSRLGTAPNDDPTLVLPPTPCDTGNSFVRWGDNPNDCLQAADFNAIVGAGLAATLDENDVIAPAWEVITSAEQVDALYRYPQPGRPDAQVMNASIQMDGNATAHSIDAVGYLDTDYLGCDASLGPCISTTQMILNDPLNLTNPDIGIGALFVEDTVNPATLGTNAGNTVTVSDDMLANEVVANNGLSVGQDLAILDGAGTGAGNLLAPTGILTINDGAGTGEIGIVSQLTEQDAATGLDINVTGGGDLVVTGAITHTGLGAGGFNVQANGPAAGNLTVLGTPPVLPGDPSGIICTGAGCNVNVAQGAASGRIDNGSSTMNIQSNNVLVFETGSLSLAPVPPGNTPHTLDAGDEILINFDCFGQACPDAITDPPPDPL